MQNNSIFDMKQHVNRSLRPVFTSYVDCVRSAVE